MGNVELIAIITLVVYSNKIVTEVIITTRRTEYLPRAQNPKEFLVETSTTTNSASVAFWSKHPTLLSVRQTLRFLSDSLTVYLIFRIGGKKSTCMPAG